MCLMCFLHLFRMSGQEKRALTRTRKYTCAQSGLPTHISGDNSDEVRKTMSSLLLGLLASLGFIYSCTNRFGPRLCDLNSAACCQVFKHNKYGGWIFEMRFWQWRLFCYKRVRSQKSVLPVYSGCLDLDAHFKEHNVKLASVYIECRLQVHGMSRPSLLRARSTHLFAQLLPHNDLTWSIHMFWKYRCVYVFK